MLSDPARIDFDRLLGFATALLAAGGCREGDARIVARHLVDANMVGHDSHGAGMLPAYLAHIRKGLVELDAELAWLNRMPTLLQADAKGGWGAPSAYTALDEAAGKAGELGLACCTLANAHHLGRIGAYAEHLSSKGLASLHFVNVYDHAPLVAPFRGSDARFGTNPICIGFPETAKNPPFLLDMATSIIALGKVRVAANKGITVPPGTLLNDQGMPTTDPSGMAGFEIRGALTPFARHKGYGLAYACEILAGVLSRSGTIQPEHERRGGIQNSMFSIILSPQAFADENWMDQEMAALGEYVTQSPPMDWDSPVIIPGAPERAWRGKREREGIPLDKKTVDQLNALADGLGAPDRL